MRNTDLIFAQRITKNFKENFSSIRNLLLNEDEYQYSDFLDENSLIEENILTCRWFILILLYIQSISNADSEKFNRMVADTKPFTDYASYFDILNSLSELYFPYSNEWRIDDFSKFADFESEKIFSKKSFVESLLDQNDFNVKFDSFDYDGQIIIIYFIVRHFGNHNNYKSLKKRFIRALLRFKESGKREERFDRDLNEEVANLLNTYPVEEVADEYVAWKLFKEAEEWYKKKGYLEEAGHIREVYGPY